MSKPATRVALVDDDDSVRRALGRLLSVSCFDISTYGSAREFLTSLMRAGIRIPTIVVTAYNEPGVRERCRSAGAAAFLVKPLNGPSLVNAINAAVSGVQG
jgi:FixJ family two-component response regulator